MNTKLFRLSALLLTALSLAALAYAGVPRTINYQGYLKNADNTPVTAATSVRFSLYSSTPPRDNPVWRETHSVTPAGGIYSVQLGSQTPITAPFDVPYYLGVKVEGDAEMALQPLTSAPYALRAGVAESTVNARTSGPGNFFSGTNAGNLAMSGAYNTASGQEALNRNTTGNQNTAGGYRALVFNTTGGTNTAAGYQSLYANTAGNGNTATGAGALQSNVSGMQNTAVGMYAGLTENGANANVSGNFNTFIGTQSGPGSATQISNATAIGYRAHVSQSNSLVLGGTDANAVKVGIGTETPTQALEVIGTVKADRFIGSGTAGDFTTQGPVSVEPSGTAAGSTGELRLKELATGGANYVGFKAPDNLAGDTVWTLPGADGTANQVLKTDGAGHLGWTDTNNATQVQSVIGTDPNGMIRGTNTATPSLGYLGGTYGVYGETSGTGTAISGRNTNTDSASSAGYGVKGQSGNSIGILGTNHSCRQVSYGCNCDWDGYEEICDTCYETVCDQPGIGVHGQATAPDYAGLFDGSVKVNGVVSVIGQTGNGTVQTIQTGNAANTGLVVQGAVLQTAKLQEWKNSTNVTVASVSPTGLFTGNGSGLTNVTASNLSINCTEGQILKKVSGTWQCSAPCEIGDMVSCYSGAAGTMNAGECRTGVRTCGTTGWSACVGQILPAAEVCHTTTTERRDFNCNGLMDDATNPPGCVNRYRDVDGDGYGELNMPLCTCISATGYASNSGDCNVNDPNVHPNSDYYTTPIAGSSPANWDYDCDGQVSLQYPDVTTDTSSGWMELPIPACGEWGGFMLVSCSMFGCSYMPGSYVQGCR